MSNVLKVRHQSRCLRHGDLGRNGWNDTCGPHAMTMTMTMTMTAASTAVRRLIVATVIVVLLAAPRPARAGVTPSTSAPSTSAPSVEEPLPRGRWYGWELILTDVLLLLAAGDGAQEKPELGLGEYQLGLALGALVLGSPALHYIHGNPRRATLGLLVRGAAVGLYALAAAELNESSAPSGADGQTGIDISAGDVILGFAAGAAVISAGAFAFIDSFWFARAPAAPRALAIVPTFSLHASGAALGLTGTF